MNCLEHGPPSAREHPQPCSLNVTDLLVFSDINGPVLCGNSMAKFLLYLYSSKLYNVRDEGLLLFCK